MKRKAVSGIMLTLVLMGVSNVVLFAELATANLDLEPDSRPGVSIIRLTFTPDAWDMQPNIAGDGSKVAFMHFDGSDYELFVVNADGTGLTQLTNNNLMERWASISRDGSKIAFVSYIGLSQGEIFVANSDGSGLTQLTDNGCDNDEPSLSADGTKIAFRSGAEIWVMNSDGTEAIKVGDNTDGSTGSGPAISGDGSKVAFLSLVDGYYEIFAVNSDGSGLTQLTNKEFKSPNRISISDDGSKITFEAGVGEDNSEIFLVNSDGSGLSRLTDYEGIDAFWNEGKNCISANGSRIAFASNKYSVSDIFVIDSYGLRVDQITNSSFRDLDPSISDDGSKIAFASERYGEYDIFLAIYEPTTPLTVSISPLSASINAGQSVTLTSTVSGGYTPYSYQWYLNGNPVSGAALSSWTFTPITSGIYYVYLTVTDAKNNTIQSETARIAVAPVPVGGYSIPIKGQNTPNPLTLYLALIAILAIVFTAIKRKIPNKK